MTVRLFAYFSACRYLITTGVALSPVVMSVTAPTFAQSIPYRKWVVEINAGITQPKGSMRTWQATDGRPLFKQSAWGGTPFGFRAAHHLQLDAGMEFSGPVVGRGVRNNVIINQPHTEVRIADAGLLGVPFGLRLVIPLLSERVLIGVGGGGSVLVHNEGNTEGDVVIGGINLGKLCEASCERRYGLGGYGLTRFEYLIGDSRRVGVGVMARFTRARLRGGYLSRFGNSSDTDQWFQFGGTVSLRF
ncbi:MAG: hypothetical protein L0387_16340 [Acidobacteria bacterium]|nr:hypothetical protein [Acidobacteriota bacterium]MCI0724576.1 hypothetical protein [Acidobacteriota bacterium]